MSDTKKKIKHTDLTVDRLENLAKMVVDRWDMQAVIEFAQEQVFQDYQYDIDRAVEDAEDYTLEELDNFACDLTTLVSLRKCYYNY